MSDIPIIIISLIFSAFFSGMEIAYVSSNKISIEIEKKKTGFISSIIKKLTKNMFFCLGQVQKLRYRDH